MTWPAPHREAEALLARHVERVCAGRPKGPSYEIEGDLAHRVLWKYQIEAARMETAPPTPADERPLAIFLEALAGGAPLSLDDLTPSCRGLVEMGLRAQSAAAAMAEYEGGVVLTLPLAVRGAEAETALLIRLLYPWTRERPAGG